VRSCIAVDVEFHQPFKQTVKLCGFGGWIILHSRSNGYTFSPTLYYPWVQIHCEA